MATVDFEKQDQQDEEGARRARLSRIVREIAGLDKNDITLFTGTGTPSVDVLTKRCGFTVSAADRDVAWAAFMKKTGETAPEAAPVLAAPDPEIAEEDAPTQPWGGKWAVIDLAATKKARTHSPIVNGPAYALTADEPTPMPQAHAVKFILPGFIVYDADGAEVAEIPDARNVAAGADPRITLRYGEVVARVNELSDTALLLRCQRFAGGEKLHASTPREDLESFLMDRTGGNHRNTSTSLRNAAPEDFEDDEGADGFQFDTLPEK